jgi:hypothetical protein
MPKLLETTALLYYKLAPYLGDTFVDDPAMLAFIFI